MSILNRIENILDSATTLGGTKDIDCEQVLKDASDAIFNLEARVSELESENAEMIQNFFSSVTQLQTENESLKQRVSELEKEVKRLTAPRWWGIDFDATVSAMSSEERMKWLNGEFIPQDTTITPPKGIEI